MIQLKVRDSNALYDISSFCFFYALPGRKTSNFISYPITIAEGSLLYPTLRWSYKPEFSIFTNLER